MAFEVDGKMYRKFDTENKSQTFQTREFVIEIKDGQYPQFVKFQLVQDRCGIVDDLQEGEQVKVHFDLRGREWQGKFFTNLQAWRVEKFAESTQAAPARVSAGGDFPGAGDEPQPLEFNDDLPF